jgi:AcrR family transcriptional regulator
MRATSALTEKQTDIADAALRVIGRQGISALTTTTLAAELGVSSGAPFRHFESRDAILDAVTRRVVDLVSTTYPDPRLPPLQRLEALFRARVNTVGHFAGVARLIFSEQFTLALPKEASERMLDLVRDTRAFVLQALEEGVECGEIRGTPPPKALLPVVMGSLQHLVFLNALPRGVAQPPAPGEVLATLRCLLAPNPFCES